MERNEYLESGGLFFESNTHEWFLDRESTQYAKKNSVVWGGGELKDGLQLVAFIIRDKSNGIYKRVLMDRETNEIVYETSSLEDLGYFIDRMKIVKRFI